ncbi:unnamed protein product [Lactuca saligna]|uniref:Phytocyanin domain-containing protein n=1 Tax=Lactuca saligna TaxID=75948 RepID=A0AA36E8N8_LACSI|nr:unnamed protein product [Lactuca saligna]
MASDSASSSASHTVLHLFWFFLLAVAAVTTTVGAIEFPVGGDVGWRIPATNETELYTVWASRRNFHIGDTLRFRYKNDSVAVVKKWGFYHCNSSSPIAFFNDGDSVINLDNVGTMYIISGDSDRCKQGEKMKLEVMGSGPGSYFPPSISSPPESSYSDIAPSPSQFSSYGGEHDVILIFLNPKILLSHTHLTHTYFLCSRLPFFSRCKLLAN